MIAKKFRTTLAASTAMALAVAASPAAAQLVSGGDLVTAEDSAGNPGQITVVNPDANTADISVLAPVVIANWTQFNVPAGTTLNVANASAAAQASLLNRVIGGGFSDIGGTINAADVNFWLLNQNGILFGSNTSVNAASFFASTLGLTDADFFDFYEGTNLAGNGSQTLNFSSPASSFMIAPAGASFVTDGSLFFAGPGLNLDATFDAGSGRVSFVAANDFNVTFSAGSPVSYTITAGTLVADQLVDGTVDGRSADFVFQTAAGVMGAMLTVDADVATTAAATEQGIYLYAGGASAASVTVGGALSSTGGIAASVSDDLTLSQNATGSYVDMRAGGALIAQDISATTGDVRLVGEPLVAGDVVAAQNLYFATNTNSGTAAFDSATATNGQVAVNGAVPDSITITGATSGASVQLLAVNLLDLGDVSSTAGAVLLNTAIGGGSGTISAGNVSATGGPATLVAPSDVTTTSISSTAAIDVDSTAGGNLSLGDLDAGTIIALDTTGSVGLGSATGGTISVGSTTAPSSASFSGAVSATDFSARVMGTLDFASINEIERISGISTGSALLLDNGLSNLTIEGQVSTGGNDVTIKNSGDITIAASGQVTGGIVALSARDQFINNRGADAITASDHWVVYSAAPAGNTFGGLDSGSTAIWNQTIDTLAPGAVNSNRYVFSFQPTVVVTSTDTSKVYGTDLTGALDGFYSVSGLQPGVAGAFLGDTAASVLSGAPTISSAGAVANADVAGGPYVMTVNQGSLGASYGYSLVLSNGGRLTVTPKPLSATLDANDKTYDGTTVGSGTVSLSGVVAGDDLGTSGTTFTFSDKNAGTDKTVTVSGTALTGGDAGNYTLTVPASALADILAKAITGSVSVNDKTYDGTTVGSGTVSLSGVVAGDDLGTSGTTFTFSDKNAGTDKTVTVSGTALTGGDAGNYTLTVPASALADILAKAITGSVSVNDKTYDGTTVGSGTVSLSGVVAGDDLGTSGTTFTFSDKNAGTDKTVTVSGTALTGGDAGNYTLTVPASALADILAKAITGSVSVNDKTYDGTTVGSGTVSLSGVVAGDDLGTSGTTFTFSDKNAGTDKTVTVSGTALTGGDAGNYTLTVPASALADILAKAITGSVSVNDKTYDGTTVGSGTVSLSGVVAGDDLGTSGTTFTFSDKNAGTDKTVTVSGTALTGGDAGNYTLTVPASALADILAKAITGSVSVNDKTYDGTTVGSGTVSLSGVVAGDDLGTSGTTFTFSDKNAGTDKTVTVSGTALTGGDAGNYTLTVPASALADILAKAITGSVSVNDKTYDGTTVGSGTVSLSGVVAGDDLGTSGTTFTFSDKNAGTDKTVTVSGTALTGGDAGNYTLTVPASALADILAKAITGSVSVNDKTYDGTTVGSGTVSLSGVVAGDDLGTSGTTFTFSDKNAGTDKTVTVSGTALTGGDAGNYTLTVPASALADILAKAITGSVSVNDKTYDGTTVGSGTVSLSGVVAGDDLGTSGTTFTFSDKNAGTDKTVTVSGTALTGGDAGNYTLTVPASALADILAKAITGSVSVNDKTYDGTTVGSGTVSLSGVVAGDDLGTSGTTFTFSDKNAGTDKTVTVSGTALTGGDAGNYTLTVPASALADILARLLVISADDQEKAEGTSDPSLTYQVGGEGLVSGDALTGSLERALGEEPGAYAIQQGSLDAGTNYVVEFEEGTLTITAESATPGRVEQNLLRALPLPSEVSSSGSSRGLVLDLTELCPEDDEQCQIAQ